MKNKHGVMHNLVMGMSGAALLMVSDWLMGATGSGNQSNGVVQSNWAKAAAWRYEASFLVAAVAVFFLYIGMKEAIRVMKLSRKRRDPWSSRMTQVFELGGTAAIVSTLFLHAKGCILPILYKKLYSTSLMGADMLAVVDEVFFYIAIPFYVLTVMVIVCTSVPYIYQILQNRIRVPRWYVLLNPMVFWVVGWIFRLFGVSVISDFTACMTSFGIMMMLWGILQHVARLPEKGRE